MTWKEQAHSLPITITGSTIKMFYLLRGLQQDLHRPGSSSVDQVAKDELSMLAKEGIKWSPNSLAEIDSVWAALGISGDWRKPKIEWIDPTGSGPLNQVSRLLNEKRDEHMVQVLSVELGKGKKILAVVGGTHVVMQEPALDGKKRKM
jgi:hypothetical protein